MSGRGGITVCAIVFVLACSVFAWWPVPHESAEAPVIDRPVRAKAQPLATLDAAAFRVPTWAADPAPAAPPASASPPPPPPPLKLQLLAIMKEGDGSETTYKAAVYDPDSDKLLVVAAGERIGTRTVDKVSQGSVTFRDDSGLRTLALKDTKGGSP